MKSQINIRAPFTLQPNSKYSCIVFSDLALFIFHPSNNVKLLNPRSPGDKCSMGTVPNQRFSNDKCAAGMVPNPRSPGDKCAMGTVPNIRFSGDSARRGWSQTHASQLIVRGGDGPKRIQTTTSKHGPIKIQAFTYSLGLLPIPSYSNSLLFLLLPIPTPSYSYSFILQLLAIPTPSYSYSFLFLLLPIPTPSYSYTFVGLLPQSFLCYPRPRSNHPSYQNLGLPRICFPLVSFQPSILLWVYASLQ